MDPLSITASVIAVLQATTATGQGLRKVVALRHAPIELQMLFNEVEALRALITTLQTALADTRPDSREALTTLLRPVHDAVLDLEKLVQYQLTHADRFNENGQPTISKSGWLKASSKVEKIRRRIWDARSNLEVGLSAQNLISGWSVNRATTEVQTVAAAVYDEIRCLRAEQQMLMALIQPRHQPATFKQGFDTRLGQNAPPNTGLEGRSSCSGIGDLKSRATLTTLDDDSSALHAKQPTSRTIDESLQVHANTVRTRSAQNIPGNAGLEQGSDVAREGAHFHSESTCITTTVRTDRCSKTCPCQCHSRTTFRSPDMLRGIIGQLMFNYTHLVQPRSCDYPLCRKQARRSTFTYFLPTWMAPRMIQISGQTGALSGRGASWSIKIPVIVSNTDVIWDIVGRGDVRMLQKELHRRDFSPFVVNNSGEGLLHIAVYYHQVEAFNLLRQAGCDLNAEDNSACTAAAFILLLRLQKPFMLCEDDLLDDMDFSVLHSAIANSSCHHVTEAIIENHSKDIDRQDRLGMTPVHWACTRADARSLRVLLSWKANANMQDRRGFSPLHHASWSDSSKCVELLLEAGAEVNSTDRFGETALYLAQKSRIIQMLVRRGTMIDLKNYIGLTALHGAILTDDYSKVRDLIACGADVSICDFKGWNAILMAVALDAASSLTHLLDHITLTQSDDRPVRSARAYRDTLILTYRQLAKLQCDLDICGGNLLHLAAQFGGVGVMKVLTQADLRGLDPFRENKWGQTPDDHFYHSRGANRTITRPPFGEEEEAAWIELMNSVRRQNGLYITSESEDEDTEDDSDVSLSESVDAGHISFHSDDGSGNDDDRSQAEEDELFDDAVENL